MLRPCKLRFGAALLAFGFVLVLGVCARTQAQQPPQGRRSAPPSSPSVDSDGKVTFRIQAPKATEVTLRGDWMEGGPQNLTKDYSGLWSITLGPLTPDFYSYAFTVDGVKTIDPVNATIKQGIAGLDNMFLVPGEEAKFQENQAVPHGQVRLVWYRSNTLDTQPGCTCIRRRATTAARISTRCCICCTGAATKTRDGARSAERVSSSTT